MNKILETIDKITMRYVKVRFTESLNLQKVSVNISWLFFDNAIRLLVNVFVGAWLARYLGSEQYGILCFAFAVVTIFSSISNLGLDVLVVRNLVKNPENRNNILGTVFGLKLCSGFVAFGLAMGASILIKSENHLTIWLVGIIALGMIFQSFDTLDIFFQSQVQSKYTVWSKNSAFLLMALVKVVLIMTHCSLIVFAWVILFETILGSAGLLYFYVSRYSSIKALSFSIQEAKLMIKECFPLLLSGLTVALYMRLDQVMIKMMLGDKALGNYAVGVSLCEAFYFLPMIISSSLSPAIMDGKKINEKMYQERVQGLYDIVVLIAVINAFLITIFSDIIIKVLFGVEFGSAASVLKIYSWAGIFTALGVASTRWILAENLSQLSLNRTIFGLVVNIASNLVFIPIWGINGAALSALLGMMSAAFIYNFLDKRMEVDLSLKLKSLSFGFIFKTNNQ